MNRVPPRDGGKRYSDSLERRINLLTLLVVVQVLLLGALLILQFIPGSETNRMDSAAKTMDETKKVSPAETKMPGKSSGNKEPAVKPVVKKPETGKLPPEVALDRAVRIEVLNACGVSRLAAKYTEILRAEGYDIRETGNAPHTSTSRIFDRTALPGQAKRLADVMGILPQYVLSKPDKKLVDIDLTLVIGSDYKSLRLKPKN